MTPLKNEKIEVLANPLALIVGESKITETLSRKLKEGSCEVVELSQYPKSGKFDYIFQFGGSDDVSDAYIKFLKPNGKFIFIDYKNEDLKNVFKNT